MPVNESCPECGPIVTQSGAGIEVRRFTPESSVSTPGGHVMAAMPERLLNHRASPQVLESMRNFTRESDATPAQTMSNSPRPSPLSLGQTSRKPSESGISGPHCLSSSVILAGPLAGSSLGGSGIAPFQLQDESKIGIPINGDDVYDPAYDLDKARQEAEAAVKLAEAQRQINEWWKNNRKAVDALRKERDDCLEEARQRHSDRYDKIESDKDDCIAAAAIAGDVLTMVGCLNTAARRHSDSLLTLKAEQDECRKTFARKFQELREHTGAPEGA